jgi:hypothetical protein
VGGRSIGQRRCNVFRRRDWLTREGLLAQKELPELGEGVDDGAEATAVVSIVLAASVEAKVGSVLSSEVRKAVKSRR